MCGLVGVMGKLAHKDEALMKRLLLLDFFRGPDSTGFAGVRSNGDTFIAKLPSHPLDLFDSQKFKTALNGHASTVFIGHNRAATRGAVSGSNAHPFEYEHIVGTHNGTLKASTHKALEELAEEKFSVDSQVLFAAIAKVGIEKTMSVVEEGAYGSEGAWSLVWYDRKENSLNFLRNKWRPLWYAYNDELDRIIWASEWAFIDGAVKMGGTDHKLYSEEEGYKYFSTEEDVWYKFDVDKMKAGGKERPKPVAKELKGKEPVAVVTTTSASDPFQRREWADQNGGRTQTTPSTMGFHGTMHQKNGGSRSSSSDKEVTLLTLLGDGDDPFAGYLGRDKFDEIAKYGCSYCSADVAWGDTGCLIYERDQRLLCPSCAGKTRQGNQLITPHINEGAAL